MGRPVHLALWSLAAVTVAIYVVMVAWSLPLISSEAAGQIPFDMRPMGYSHEQAMAFLTALSTEGRDHYRTVQHSLDALFPPLNAALIIGLALAAGRNNALPRRLVRLLVAVVICAALAGCLFDWLENSAVAGLLEAEPQAVTPEMTAGASTCTRLKSLSVTVALSGLFVIAIGWAIGRRRAELR